MNPLWKKAKWDVVPKEDLEAWYACESAMNPAFLFDDDSWGDPQMDEDLDSWLDERPQEMKDKEVANLALFEEMAKENPELRRIADNLLNALGGLADIDDEDFSDFIEMDMMCDRIWMSSMNQVLDEDVDFSGDPKLFFNLNEFLKTK